MADVVDIEQKIANNGYLAQPHQAKWHDSNKRFLVAVCGRQIGKTYSAVNELIRRSLRNQGTRNWYVTNDYTQAKRNVWDLCHKFVTKEMNALFNDSELKITFPNQSKIELIGVANAQSLRGAVVHFMILDEYADFSRSVFPEVLRPMLSTTSGDVWFIGTPKGAGNDFYDRFYNIKEGVPQPPDEKTNYYKLPSCELIEGKVSNFLSKYSQAEEIQHAYDMDGTSNKAHFRQEYLAEFTKPMGTVYSEWPEENFKEVLYDVSLPLHMTMDFGINDPTAIIWIQPNGSEYRVIDYYEASDANLEHFISVIRSKPYKPPELITGDPAGNARELSSGLSPINIFNKAGYFIRTKVIPNPQIPTQIRMTHGIIKGIYVDKHLTRFRDCMLNYRYPESSEFEGLRNQKNQLPIQDEYSLAMRALEYYAVNVKDLPQKQKAKGYESGYQITTHKKTTYKGYRRTR